MSSKIDSNISYFFQQTLVNMASKIIYADDQGHYIFYDKYRLFNGNGSIIVEKFSDQSKYEFTTTKIASTWIILDHANKIMQCNRVLELDRLLAGALVDAMIHSKHKNINAISGDKLQHDLYRQKQIQHEIDKYITLAKNCQEQRYKNDIQRIV